MCDRDELTLCQLHDVVPPVDVHQPVGRDLGHHVAGEVVAIGVEGGSGDLWSLVVARCSRLRLDQQFPPGIGLVGAEVAQFGHVDEFVVEHRRPQHRVVLRDHADFGEAVAVGDVYVEDRIQEGLHLGGERCGGDEATEHSSAE